MSFIIKGIAKYLPGSIISSGMLDKNAGTRQGWIAHTTGVTTRYWAAPGETIAGMAARALTTALQNAQLKAADIDLLIFSGSCFDHPVPHTSVIIKSLIADDTVTFNCFDINTTCLSFIQAVETATLYLDSGRCRRIAIVSAEMPSIAVHPADPKVYGLFGDAAVAVILEQAPAGQGITMRYSNFKNYASGATLTRVPLGGAAARGIGEPAANPGHYFQMNGKGLMRLGAQYLAPFISELEAAAGCRIRDIDHIAPHQASRLANEYFMRQCRLAPAQVTNTLHKYGNCVSASVPLGLEAIINGETIITGKKILLIGTGAGFTLGCVLLQA